MKYVWNRNNVAVDVVEQDPYTLFTADFAKNFETCNDEVQTGWLWKTDHWEAPPPPTSTILTKYEFLTRFTAIERIGIRTASKSDPIIEDFLELLNVSEEVDVSNPNTINGVDYLIEQELLAADRRGDILAPVLI